MIRKPKSNRFCFLLVFALFTCAVQTIAFAAEYTFKTGNGRFVQLTLPDGWTYCTEGMGDTQIIIYYGTPGLSMLTAGQEGFDAIRISAYPSDKSSFTDADKEEFFQIEGLPGLKDSVRLAESDDTLSILCELNQMWRITGNRLVDGHKVIADEYIRCGILLGESEEDYLHNRCDDYFKILYSARVITDPEKVAVTPVIELKSSAGYEKAEKVLFFIFSNLKWIGLFLVALITFAVIAIKKALKKRKHTTLELDDVPSDEKKPLSWRKISLGLAVLISLFLPANEDGLGYRMGMGIGLWIITGLIPFLLWGILRILKVKKPHVVHGIHILLILMLGAAMLLANSSDIYEIFK